MKPKYPNNIYMLPCYHVVLGCAVLCYVVLSFVVLCCIAIYCVVKENHFTFKIAILKLDIL